MQASSGRLADTLAMHYDKVLICTRVVYGPPPASTELPLEAPTCLKSDMIFVRGMCPYIGVLYLCAFLFQRPICHWIVGNPVALLRTGKQNGRLLDTLAILYALQDRLATRVGRWLTDGAFLCNGRE